MGIIRDGHLVEVEAVETLLDRGGKEVRVHVAETVDAGDFAIDGAHDIDVSGGEDHSAQTVETDGSGAWTDGGDAPGSDATAGYGTSVSFTYTSAYDALLSHLLEYTIIDLDIEEAPLEDVFMRFYGDRGGETDV